MKQLILKILDESFSDDWYKDVSRRVKENEDSKNPDKFFATHIDPRDNTSKSLGSYDSYKDAYITTHSHIKDHTLQQGLQGRRHTYMISRGPYQEDPNDSGVWANNDISFHTNDVADQFRDKDAADKYGPEVEDIRGKLYK